MRLAAPPDPFGLSPSDIQRLIIARQLLQE